MKPAVKYQEVAGDYFEKRTLKRHARVGSLWALGVGAVISGDFFGWNFGLLAGGFGGMLVATSLMTLMYLGLCFSIAELSPALPHAGGAYSFARSALGPWGGYVTGLAENMEYILTPAVIVVAIGNYLGQILGTSQEFQPVWWMLTYGVFIGLNVLGVALSFSFTVLITLLALGILFTFYIAAIPHLDFAKYAFTIPVEAGQSQFLPKGWAGVLAALPFAMWFFLAIEELPLAAEEAHDPVRDMPRGILLGFATLVVCAFLTLIVSAGLPPGALVLGASQEPLFAGFVAIFGQGIGSKLLALIAVSGLVASFHTIIFAYGRQIFSLSRAGYFPHVLSLTHHKHKTPHVALMAGGALGYVVALLIFFLGPQHPVGAVLLNMAVFGAVVSYVLQMVSFVMLRLRAPHLPRPYRSPLGITGAVVALLLALVTLATLFVVDPVYRLVALGAALWFAAGIAYFALIGRHRLVSAPEELVADGLRR